MAAMIPVEGPRQGCSHVEARLYERLRTALPATCVAIHQPRWVARSEPGKPLADGGASFAIADPDRGIALLEVVIGGLAFDPSRDRWSTAGPGERRVTDDPFARLGRAADGLGDVIANHRNALPTRPVIAHAVVLPDIIAPVAGFASWAPRALIIDLQQLDDLPAAITALFKSAAAARPEVGNASPRWWWRVFEELFVAPREVRMRLGARLDRDRSEMLALGDRQKQVLELLGQVRRLTVYGPAGTGKTVLAIEKALRLARKGYRVLLTCYNKALGEHLRQATADEPSIRAVHFHELCAQLLRSAGSTPRVPTDPAEKRRYFDDEQPARLLAVADRLDARFTALVVDEGQDFLPSWWQALAALCEEPDRAVRYIFFDDRQRIFFDESGARQEVEVPGADEAVVLQTNWRNTRSIHRDLGRVEPSISRTPCASPDGVPVDRERLAPSRRAAVQRVLRRLLEDGVQPRDIVFLCGRAPTRSRLLALEQPIAGQRFTTRRGGDGILVSTPYAFKGLESPVIVLTELDHRPVHIARRLYYVGASRAMTHLVVLSDAMVPAVEDA